MFWGENTHTCRQLSRQVCRHVDVLRQICRYRYVLSTSSGMQAREAAQTAALTEKTSSRCPRRTSPASSVSTNTVMAMAPLTNDTVLKQGHQQRAADAARNLGYNSLNGTAWRIEGECTCTVHVGVAAETSLNGGCTRAMDDRLARASWCQHTTPGRPTQYVLSDGDERRRVEGLHVGGAKAVAAVEPGVELVVQLVEVTQVEPRVLRPASRAQHARLLANQLQPQHAAASSATTTARSSVSGNHDSTQQRQRLYTHCTRSLSGHRFVYMLLCLMYICRVGENCVILIMRHSISVFRKTVSHLHASHHHDYNRTARFQLNICTKFLISQKSKGNTNLDLDFQIQRDLTLINNLSDALTAKPQNKCFCRWVYT